MNVLEIQTFLLLIKAQLLFVVNDPPNDGIAVQSLSCLVLSCVLSWMCLVAICHSVVREEIELRQFKEKIETNIKGKIEINHVVDKIN